MGKKLEMLLTVSVFCDSLSLAYYLFRRYCAVSNCNFWIFQSLHEGAESPMARGSPAGSLSKKHFAVSSRSPGESSDRKVSRMQMGNLISSWLTKTFTLQNMGNFSHLPAINWITGKSGNHEDHPSGLQAAMEAAEAAAASEQLPSQAPLSRKYSTYKPVRVQQQQKGG